jgi:hypothetical protein
MLTNIAACILLSIAVPGDDKRAPELSRDNLIQRHQAFVDTIVGGEISVHKVLLGNKYNLDSLYREGIQEAIDSTRQFLGEFGEKPPGTPAWNDSQKVTSWRNGMSQVQRDLNVFQSGMPPKIIVSRIARMWDYDQHIEPFSGYPAGTFAFFELMADMSLAQELDPAFRVRIAAELCSHLREDARTFVRMRRPLVPANDQANFDRAVATLVEDMCTAIRTAGPITPAAIESLEKQYVAFGSRTVPGIPEEQGQLFSAQ